MIVMVYEKRKSTRSGKGQTTLKGFALIQKRKEEIYKRYPSDVICGSGSGVGKSILKIIYRIAEENGIKCVTLSQFLQKRRVFTCRTRQC